MTLHGKIYDLFNKYNIYDNIIHNNINEIKFLKAKITHNYKKNKLFQSNIMSNIDMNKSMNILLEDFNKNLLKILISTIITIMKTIIIKIIIKII